MESPTLGHSSDSPQLRPYYEYLALLHGHFEEVDQLLAGETPVAIATSFAHGSYYARKDDRHAKWARSVMGLEDADVRDEEAGERTELLGGNAREQRKERLASFALKGD